MTIKTLLIGQRFGKLKVLGDGPPKVYADGVSHRTSLCLCDCGTTKAILSHNIRRGLTISCGCMQREVTALRSTIHGFAKRKQTHPIYRTWKGMWRRCTKPESDDWENYGGRGIVVCERWKSFSSFMEDMLPTWKPGFTIERVDNSKGYSKENCVWATRQDQNNNKRNVHPITFNGQTKTLVEWSSELGGNKALLHIRLRRGWSIERAVSTPAHP